MQASPAKYEFASKAGAYLEEYQDGKAQVLPANIRLGWKGLSGANTLAYLHNFISLRVTLLLPQNYMESHLLLLLLGSGMPYCCSITGTI